VFILRKLGEFSGQHSYTAIRLCKLSYKPKPIESFSLFNLCSVELQVTNLVKFIDIHTHYEYELIVTSWSIVCQIAEKGDEVYPS
jgi:hypothetical protein